MSGWISSVTVSNSGALNDWINTAQLGVRTKEKRQHTRYPFVKTRPPIRRLLKVIFNFMARTEFNRSDINTGITFLVEMIYHYLNGLDDHRLDPYLADWPSRPYQIRDIIPSLLPVTACLPELDAAADAQTMPIVKTLQASAPHLRWGQTYTSKDLGAAFLENYGWTELIGLRGPISSNEIACGFLLLGRNTEYPKHHHMAEEVYIPLTQPTQWVRGNDDWVTRSCGAPIYHRSGISHGLRTESTPLLALYLWRGGDLVQKSHID
jgi:hypothetical protein